MLEQCTDIEYCVKLGKTPNETKKCQEQRMMRLLGRSLQCLNDIKRPKKDLKDDEKSGRLEKMWKMYDN